MIDSTTVDVPTDAEQVVHLLAIIEERDKRIAELSVELEEAENDAGHFFREWDRLARLGRALFFDEGKDEDPKE